MTHPAASPLTSFGVVSVQERTSAHVARRAALAVLLAVLAPGCCSPAPALRALWREVRPEPWRPVEIEAAARVGPRGDWWVRVRMHDGRRVDDVIAPWSRSQAHRPWVMPHPQPLGARPEVTRAVPPGATPVATRSPAVPRLELRPPAHGFVSHGIFLVEVEGAPGVELGRYGAVPGTREPRWRRDRRWLRVLLTAPAAVVDAALFVINIPYYVLLPRGFHT